MASFIVMPPVTVTVPVVSVNSERRLLFPVADILMYAQVNVPAFTASTLLSPEPVPAPILTAPLTLRLFNPVMETVLLVLPLLMVSDLQTAAVFTLMVAVMPLGITTSCAAVGTWFNDQLEAVFQLALELPSHVFVCAEILCTDSSMKSKTMPCPACFPNFFNWGKIVFIPVNSLMSIHLPFGKRVYHAIELMATGQQLLFLTSG